eukprot:2330805-Rhodomonas_salina.1
MCIRDRCEESACPLAPAPPIRYLSTAYAISVPHTLSQYLIRYLSTAPPYAISVPRPHTLCHYCTAHTTLVGW